MSIVTLDKENFEQEVIKSDRTVLVDFWASWCGPCKAISPIVEEIASTYSDRIKVGKLNVDENQALAGQFNIRSIPTLAIFKNGQEFQRTVGYQGKQHLINFIDTNL
ncbi:MAG: thioredoxin [Chitinophagales bacterium]